VPTSSHSLFSGGAGVEDAGITNAGQTGLGITGSMTPQQWLRPSAIGRIHTLQSKWLVAGNQRSYKLSVNAANQLQYEYSDDGTALRLATSAAITGWAISKWFGLGAKLIAATPEVQFYLNGSPFGAPVAIAGPGTIFDGTADYRIGNFHGGAAADNFRGHIDAVKIYDDERTDDEVRFEYLEAPIAGSNIQGGYVLDDVLTDISGNGNTIVLSGASFVEGEVHGYIPGRGSGMVLDIGLSFTFRMRADDATLGREVYWDSLIIDVLGDDYTGPGPLADVAVTKRTLE